MTKISSKIVLITGGAYGIGKLMGREVLKRSGKLVIWDVNKLNLQQTLKEFEEFGEVYGYTIDITNTVWVKEMAKQVEDEIGPVDVLINNAGIVYGGYFHENSSEKIEKTMKVNAIAPMQLAQTFLPGMMTRKEGHICNITSSAGLVSNPKMAVYAGSKWAATGWSDSLRLEMKQLKSGVGITTVTPYYINTGMFDGVKSNIPILDQYKVSKRIIRAIENNRVYLSMPWSMRFVRFSQGLFPIWFYDWFVGRVIGVYKTMDEFKGRKK
ncbi:SDR family oxidoreductase [Salegentibacter sp. LM13S]|uniref:SDR family oxidoreductase n=1 Tax=Salegentibacter lacus TaxID=2873599 RepID=UPI001CCE1D06|nr:SDR family oxidoreductase [Salegentibacter lacus]MBZ9631171.1 SDR family oxidoreductase [Salegentibacter lacus]